jgi:hypothetical protein
MTTELHGGRMLDTAKGILIGLRRCPSEAAFHELLGAAQRHRMPVFAMAWALVHLADGGEYSAHISTDAQSAARHEWGELFIDSAVPVG